MNTDAPVDATTRERVERCVIETIVSFGADPAAVAPRASLAALDTDVLDLLALSQVVQSEFGVRIRATDAEAVETVGDVIDVVVGRLG